MTKPLDATHADPFAGAPTFSLANRVERFAFGIVWLLCARWTPPQARRWRNWLLRRFGAKLALSANVYPSARIWLPRNLTMQAFSSLGPGVICYSMAPIKIGRHVVISQRAHLCCGTHAIRDPHFQLRAFPITIGDDAWIAAEAFVGPGITVAEGAVLAARGAAFSDLEEWTVYRGNPAQILKPRARFQRARQ
ncbi:putative colanic acid biosynthesis acetyltransferase [Celeribacter ethanolicus]|uniref:Putative colanic acid biosynthesis acetyltransferase n=1 Tax=Celeribacter ethanolicus TaxID=1758178 RepID=A0A291GHY4_9RHOB|nr:putative colanic acid biosynthesis acetyltransferase [Celeribacter ethanolicus]ATG49801.1 putative colanic acid biosynthesis acetyltransferase [Celeribacter ethanolicus]